jgi:hypothetical protein
MESFYQDLQKQSSEKHLLDFCRKRVIHGTPYVFERREDDYYEFRKRISEKFEVSFHEVYITGSAKLGFSYHKDKYFDLDSDIDVAIISSELFEKIMESIRKYQMDLRQARKSITGRELKMYHDFLEYVAIGWIRPDKLPLSFQIKELKNDWFEFFKSISNGKSEVGNYKVNAGVFKNYFHLESYLVNGMAEVRNSLNVGEK